jgi:hypothetical protein
MSKLKDADKTSVNFFYPGETLSSAYAGEISSSEEVLSSAYVSGISGSTEKEQLEKLIQKKEKIIEYMKVNEGELVRQYRCSKFMRKILYVMLDMPAVVDVLELSDEIITNPFEINFNDLFIASSTDMMFPTAYVAIPVTDFKGKDMGIIRIWYTQKLDEYLNQIL